MPYQRPGNAWQNAWVMRSGSGRNVVEARKTWPEVPSDTKPLALADRPDADTADRRIAPAARQRDPGPQAPAASPTRV